MIETWKSLDKELKVHRHHHPTTAMAIHNPDVPLQRSRSHSDTVNNLEMSLV